RYGRGPAGGGARQAVLAAAAVAAGLAADAGAPGHPVVPDGAAVSPAAGGGLGRGNRAGARAVECGPVIPILAAMIPTSTDLTVETRNKAGDVDAIVLFVTQDAKQVNAPQISDAEREAATRVLRAGVISGKSGEVGLD